MTSLYNLARFTTTKSNCWNSLLVGTDIIHNIGDLPVVGRLNCEGCYQHGYQCTCHFRASSSRISECWMNRGSVIRTDRRSFNSDISVCVLSCNDTFEVQNRLPVNRQCLEKEHIRTLNHQSVSCSMAKTIFCVCWQESQDWMRSVFFLLII